MSPSRDVAPDLEHHGLPPPARSPLGTTPGRQSHRRPGHNPAGPRCLGSSESQVGLSEQATDHLKQALAIAVEQQDIAGQAHILNALDMAITRTADSARGLDYAQQSLRLFRMLEQPVWVARKLNSGLLGRPNEALAACIEALAITREHGDGETEAATLDSLGTIAAATGDHRTALRRFQEALAVSADLGADYRFEDILDPLGAAYLGLGEPERAREQ